MTDLNTWSLNIGDGNVATDSRLFFSPSPLIRNFDNNGANSEQLIRILIEEPAKNLLHPDVSIDTATNRNPPRRTFLPNFSDTKIAVPEEQFDHLISMINIMKHGAPRQIEVYPGSDESTVASEDLFSPHVKIDEMGISIVILFVGLIMLGASTGIILVHAIVAIPAVIFGAAFVAMGAAYRKGWKV